MRPARPRQLVRPQRQQAGEVQLAWQDVCRARVWEQCPRWVALPVHERAEGGRGTRTARCDQGWRQAPRHVHRALVQAFQGSLPRHRPAPLPRRVHPFPVHQHQHHAQVRVAGAGHARKAHRAWVAHVRPPVWQVGLEVHGEGIWRLGPGGGRLSRRPAHGHRGQRVHHRLAAVGGVGQGQPAHEALVDPLGGVGQGAQDDHALHAGRGRLQRRAKLAQVRQAHGGGGG